MFYIFFFFFSSRRRHTRSKRDWSSDVCSSDLFKTGGGSKGKAQNAAAVVVFDERIKSDFARARADRENRKLASERHEAFEDESNGRQLRFGPGDILRSAENPLAFAVVAHAGSLQNGGETNMLESGAEFGVFRNGCEFGRGDAEFLK